MTAETALPADPGRNGNGSGAQRIIDGGVRVTATYEWVRFQALLGSSNAGDGSDSVTLTGCRFGALLTATSADGAALAWQPERIDLHHHWPPRPGSTCEVAYLPDDVAQWAIADELTAPPAHDVPRGWSGGDTRELEPAMAQERAAFRAGRQVLAEVRNVHWGANHGNLSDLTLILRVDGAEQEVRRAVGACNRTDPAIWIRDEIVVAVSPAGDVVALDTDERYLGNGQCLVWSPLKREQIDAYNRPGTWDETLGDRDAAGRTQLTQSLGDLDAQRAAGTVTDVLYRLNLEVILSTAHRKELIDGAEFTRLLADRTGETLTPELVQAHLAANHMDPVALGIWSLESDLARLRKARTKRFHKLSDEEYHRRVGEALDRAVRDRFIDDAARARYEAESG